MKAEQISEHVWSLKSWMVIPFHVWVVIQEDGVTLVDAGIPAMAKGIVSFIKELQAGPLKRIVLTHGHSDHVGSLKRILEDNQVPVYAHHIELPYMEGAIPYPLRKKAAQSVQPGVAQALAHRDDGQLAPIGGLTPYLTPGHSPGHVVYYHEQDRVLLAGDLFTSKGGKLQRPMPMFTPDMAEAVKSSEIVALLRPERLEVCHGNPVLKPAEHIEAYQTETLKKYVTLKNHSL